MELLDHPLHPYTRRRPARSASRGRSARVARAPAWAARGADRSSAAVPVPRALPHLAADICRSRPHPALEDKGSGHQVVCYLA